MKFLTLLPSKLIITCSAIGLITSACKQSSSVLPPTAIGEGKDSSNLDALNNVKPQAINSYQNWDFGKDAYQHTKNILDFGVRPIESEGHKKTQKYYFPSRKTRLENNASEF